MQLPKPLLTAALAAALVGCAGHPSNPIPAEPTLASIQASPSKAQVYKGTLYTLADFKATGERKRLMDYNFTMETAPCTVLGSAYVPPPTPRETFYAVTGPDGQPHAFVCRSTLGPNSYRLILVNSELDCMTRVRTVVANAYWPKSPPRVCQPDTRTLVNERAEARYLQSFFRGPS